MSQTSRKYDYLVRTIFLGESGVGKTAIWYRYCNDEFLSNYTFNIGIEWMTKTIEVDTKKVKLQIWDTAGQEKYRAISQSYCRWAHGVILCYAINNRESFEKIEYWMEEAKKHNIHDKVCFILVGTKSDLSDQRVVSFDEGKTFAESNRIKFFETSAKKSLGINEAFLALARDMCEEQDKEVSNKLNQKGKNSQIQTNCFKCS